MNHSSLTRKEQVLARLREHLGSWVDGNLIMTAECGGQRGGARVKDLRDDGYAIESRKHPDPKRDVWQYRLVAAPPSNWKEVHASQEASQVPTLRRSGSQHRHGGPQPDALAGPDGQPPVLHADRASGRTSLLDERLNTKGHRPDEPTLAPSWKCSSCGNPLGAIPPSLTDKYANAYCRHCKGSRVFTP